MSIPLIVTCLAAVFAIAFALNMRDKLQKARADLAALNEEYSAREAAYAIAQVALKHLSIWQANQLKGRYERASQEAEMIKNAADDHRKALAELRSELRTVRNGAVIQFVAQVRGLAESGRMRWDDALLHAEAQFTKEGDA